MTTNTADTTKELIKVTMYGRYERAKEELQELGYIDVDTDDLDSDEAANVPTLYVDRVPEHGRCENVADILIYSSSVGKVKPLIDVLKTETISIGECWTKDSWHIFNNAEHFYLIKTDCGWTKKCDVHISTDYISPLLQGENVKLVINDIIVDIKANQLIDTITFGIPSLVGAKNVNSLIDFEKHIRELNCNSVCISAKSINLNDAIAIANKYDMYTYVCIEAGRERMYMTPLDVENGKISTHLLPSFIRMHYGITTDTVRKRTDNDSETNYKLPERDRYQRCARRGHRGN